jgi:hypothetical protein
LLFPSSVYVVILKEYVISEWYPKLRSICWWNAENDTKCVVQVEPLCLRVAFKYQGSCVLKLLVSRVTPSLCFYSIALFLYQLYACKILQLAVWTINVSWKMIIIVSMQFLIVLWNHKQDVNSMSSKVRYPHPIATLVVLRHLLNP